MGRKRERVASEVGESTAKPSKKLMKSVDRPQKTEPPPQGTFTPFDYSQSDLKVFASEFWGFLAGVIQILLKQFVINCESVSKLPPFNV